jgi:hypothetical protein
MVAKWPRHLADHAPDVGDGIDALGLGRIGARRHERPAARNGGIDALDAGGVGAGDDEQTAVAPRIERGLDPGQHVGERDNLLARQVATAVREHLVAEEQPGDAGRLERPHHLADIVDAAEAGIAVHIDWNVHRGADAGIVVGIVAHIALAHIGLPHHAADRGIAAGNDGFEPLGLHDLGRQRIIGAGHRHQAAARDQFPEPLPRAHGGDL